MSPDGSPGAQPDGTRGDVLDRTVWTATDSGCQGTCRSLAALLLGPGHGAAGRGPAPAPPVAPPRLLGDGPPAPRPGRRRLVRLVRPLLASVLVALVPRPAPAAGPAPDLCAALGLPDVAALSGVSFVHDRGGTGARHLPETMGAGLAWLDFDGDGWMDLYLVQSGPFPPDGRPRPPDRLFRNLDGRRFAEVRGAGANDRGYGQGATAADFDGDGMTDLYLTAFGPDRLLRNRGDGTFEDATGRVRPAAAGWSSSAAFADADRDGDLDLYVARYLRYDPGSDLFCAGEDGTRTYCDPSLFQGEPDVYYRNRGDGTFEEAAAAAGLAEAEGKGLGVLFMDLDGDAAPDLYVADDLTPNLLFRNRGDGTFEDVSLASGAAVSREGKALAGMGLAAGDVDGDLKPDLGVTNFDVEVNSLYRNLGGLQFEDASAASGFGPPSFNLLGFGLVFADLDLDGQLDAYAANGHIFERPRRESVSYAQRDLLLLGDGKGRFRELRCPVLAARPQVGRGLAAADFDGDGDPDLGIQRNGGPAALLRNDFPAGRWLGVVLRGRAPNTGAVGARVTLSTAAGKQVRWATAGDSYQSTSDPRLLFGLPAGEPPLELEISWPSGARQRVLTPPEGRYLLLQEPSHQPKP